jgi:hypothetical protein
MSGNVSDDFKDDPPQIITSMVFFDNMECQQPVSEDEAPIVISGNEMGSKH